MNTLEAAYKYGTDFTLGFTPVEPLSLYALVSAIWQTFEESDGLGGFGYGGGVEYRINFVV